MNLNLKFIPVAAAFVFSVSAHAFPIAPPGTDGLLVIASGGNVTATYQGNSASYSNDLYLENTGTFVFNNHANIPGDTVDLGAFAAGTELKFRMHVNNTGDDFFTGPASRNPDSSTHARVQTNWQPGEALVSFEDLFNGPFDYNDLSFSFTNTVAGVPEPSTYALLMAGLACVSVIARRRRSI
ncbi:MAG: PEP-CTERM sorting domain-containing protein [Burkholderiaceae bacterium]|nr:PEP-CTERM sorting domain-containing protein [Burkholderiaceae bacterium]MDH3460846.1 PEP-CTERM sorting domain-containing protein [Burkholderiaceae bacterium]